MGGAIKIRDKRLVERLRHVAARTGEPVQQIAERAVVGYLDAHEAARESADQHLRDNASLVDQLRGGDPQALRDLLDGYEGTRLKQTE